jgi:hypothetical protein
MRLILFSFALLCTATGATQSSAIFPAQRHAELREEVVYVPEEEEIVEPEPFESFEPFDWEPYRWPAIYLISILLGSVLIYLVYRLLLDMGYIKVRPRTAAPVAVTVEEIDEEVVVAEGVPLSLLERAEQGGQYAIAIRLLYLQTLKVLQDDGHLRYRRDYSNHDYLDQLRGNVHRPAFARVTELYERYWYGDYPVDRLTYRAVRTSFTSLTETLSHAGTH